MIDNNRSKDGKPCASDDAWNRLDELESKTVATISNQLAAFDAPFRDAYEPGVIVPVLRANRRAVLDVRFAALYLKRVLNDLRSVWLLLHNGYTFQAASVATSLYESSVATICLKQSNDSISDFQSKDDCEFTWSITEMAKMVTRTEGKDRSSKDFENGWRALHAHYPWLCQIVVHDNATSSLATNQYVVMALPNVRDEDVSVKAMVSIISLQRTLESIEAFAKSLGFIDQMPDDFNLRERFQRARDSAWAAFEPFLTSPNPISIGQSRFAKKCPPVK